MEVKALTKTCLDAQIVRETAVTDNNICHPRDRIRVQSTRALPRYFHYPFVMSILLFVCFFFFIANDFDVLFEIHHREEYPAIGIIMFAVVLSNRKSYFLFQIVKFQ